MIFYIINVGGNTVDWAGTQADAREAKKKAEAQHHGETVTWEEHDVPTDKPTLLEFLKANCVGKPIAVVKKPVTTHTSTPS